jgi:hypothetical protein
MKQKARVNCDSAAFSDRHHRSGTRIVHIHHAKSEIGPQLFDVLPVLPRSVTCDHIEELQFAVGWIEDAVVVTDAGEVVDIPASTMSGVRLTLEPLSISESGGH